MHPPGEQSELKAKSRSMTLEPISTRIRRRLENVDTALGQIVGLLTTKRAPQSRTVVSSGPGYYFPEPTPEARTEQVRLKREYDDAAEILRVLVKGAPSDLQVQFQEAEHAVRIWVELSANHALTSNPNRNVEAMKSDFKSLYEMLNALSAARDDALLVVPAANALVNHPDPAAYRDLVEVQSFDFVLLTTVLAELDHLKNNDHNPEFRDKVSSAIRRIKGWRQQGSLRDGVMVDQTLKVRALHEEPDQDVDGDEEQRDQGRPLRSVLVVVRDHTAS